MKQSLKAPILSVAAVAALGFGQMFVESGWDYTANWLLPSAAIVFVIWVLGTITGWNVDKMFLAAVLGTGAFSVSALISGWNTEIPSGLPLFGAWGFILYRLRDTPTKRKVVTAAADKTTTSRAYEDEEPPPSVDPRGKKNWGGLTPYP